MVTIFRLCNGGYYVYFSPDFGRVFEEEFLRAIAYGCLNCDLGGFEGWAVIALLPRVGLRQSPLGAATLLAREEPWRRGVVLEGEDDGQGRQFVAADDKKRPEEGVPRPVEVDHDCGEQQWSGDWIGDLEDDVEVVGAVDDGGVDVLVVQREKGLAQEENGKGGDGAG